MPFKLGSTTVASFRLGQNAVSGIYAGSTSVWSATSAPGVPTSLSGSRGNTQVVLTWSAPASDGGSAITDYVVQYSSNAGSTWTTFSDSTSSSTGATVTGLSNGTAYVFRVAAVNAVGTGSYTAASASVTPATTPGTPTSLSGTRGNAQVVLTWSAPASNGGSAVTDYTVQYSSDSGSNWTTFSDGTSSSTGATVTGLSNGTAYVFRVAAVNAVGAGSYTAASASVTPATTPDAPTSVAGTAGDEEVVLTWSAPASNGGSAVTDYTVQYSSDSGSNWTTFSDGTSSSTGATVTGLSNGTAYVFRVAAVNAVGTGSYTAASASVTPTVPCTESVLLLHFDGDDEDVTTTDSSASAHGSITFNGDAQIDTAESKFGGSSLLLDGDGDYVSVPYSSDFDFGTGDFTIEMWARVTGTTAQQVSISAGGYPTGWAVYVGDSVGTSFACNDGDGWTGVNANSNPPAETWFHVAVVRYSGVTKIYVDGAEVASSESFAGNVTANESELRIGIDGSYGPLAGHIDDVRIVKGLAVYRAEFSPPTSQLSACATVAPASAPAAPTAVSGTAGDTQVSLTWTEPASNGGSAITDYVIEYSSDSGSTWSTFSDGTSTDTTATVTGLTNDTAYTFRVAAVNAVGTGSYSTASDAVTPTVPCTESVLLLHFDGDDEDTTTTDSSTSNHSITFNGDAMISTSQSKFGGSSLLVDGTGDCTVAPDGDWFNFGSGDFTIEAWVYPLSTSGAHAVASIRSSSETDLAFALYVLDGSSYLVLSSSGTSWAVNAGGSETIAADEWSHMALVRYGSSVKVYVNGALSQSHTFSDSVFNSSEPLRVGSGVLSSPNQDFYGYIDDFRVVKGLAVYQDEFDPPSAQLSACATVAPPATNPLLTDLVAFYKLSDNTDSSGNGYTLTETNVTYDTGKVGNSAVFDGTAYLSTSSLPSLSSEMTLTLWFKITGADSEDFLIGCGSSDGAFYLVRASGDVKAAVSGTGEVFAGGSGAADGSWHFAAVVRTATTLKVWLDATSGSGSGAYSSINSPSPFKIGSNWDGTYLLMNGNIDAVGLWSRALSDSEIAEMYASGSGLELP